MTTNFFCCPVCGEALSGEKTLRCPNGHCFDRARSGYVNLLPPRKAAGKEHGDDKDMILARRRFLSGGYYAPLCQALCEMAQANLKALHLSVLDTGCGEGYYTGQLVEALSKAGKQVSAGGIDISKAAVQAASTACRNIDFAVASCYHLPVADGGVDLLCSLFAPIATEEFARVLCPDGMLLLAIPGEKHLMELKKAVYDTPYEKPVRPLELPGFTLIARQELCQTLQLPDGQTVSDLFEMTPFSYKTSPSDREKLAWLDRLQVTAHFLLLGYRKQASAQS